MAIDLELLKTIWYFEGLSQEELESIKGLFVEKTANKGDIFMFQGQWTDYLYFIATGIVKVYKTSPDGKEQILHLAPPGDSLNDVSTFDGGPNAASMYAMTPVLLYGIKKNDIKRLLGKYPKICINVIRVLSSKVRRDSNLLEDLSFNQVTGRLAKVLLKYADDDSETDTWPKLTQQDMAALVGTTREVVNRSLRTLEEEGTIRLERHRIRILKRDALHEMAKDSSEFIPKRLDVQPEPETQQ
jgi:CRP-like cAMP-binding protein